MWILENRSEIMMNIETVNLKSGDKLILFVGSSQRVWTVSAVNNQVMKYFDENGHYGQMPMTHLKEMLRQDQVRLESKESFG